MKILMFIPTYGKKCGIAEYSAKLVKEFENQKHLVIVSNNVEEVISGKIGDKFDCLHIQHEYGILSGECFVILCHWAKLHNIPIFVTMHSLVKNNMRYDFYNILISDYADKVIVHSQNQKEYFTISSSKNNTTIIPLGMTNYNIKDNYKFSKDKIRIATFGLFSTGKGLTEIIIMCEKFMKFSNLKIELFIHSPFNDVCSHIVIKQQYSNFLSFAERFDWVEVSTDYSKSLEDIVKKLNQYDLIFLNYKSSNALDIASVSSAVNESLASLRPVIVTNINHFSYLSDDVVYKIHFSNEYEFTNILENYKYDWKEKVNKARIFLEENSFKNVVKKHIDLYKFFCKNIKEKNIIK